MELVPALARWLHFLAGVMWIGLLYYFNFVQVPALKAAGADGTAGRHHQARRAARPAYFRWSALVTWLAGAALLGAQFVPAFTLSKGMAGIGVGAWLGTIMLFNVWVSDLAQSAEDPGHEAGDRRGKDQGAAHRVSRVADQRDAVDADAVLHGRRLVASGAVRNLGADIARGSGPDTPEPEATGGAPPRDVQSPYSFWTRSRRSCASSDSVAVGRASSRGMPIGSPVSSQ